MENTKACAQICVILVIIHDIVLVLVLDFASDQCSYLQSGRTEMYLLKSKTFLFKTRNLRQ